MDSYEPVKIAYDVFEPSSGTDETLSPIIFLHGITSTKDYWDYIPQIIADKTKRKAYAYDTRNHGESGYSEKFSFDLNVQDLFHFMDSHNITKAILIGHSMGGITSAHAALSKPERVEKLFVEDIFIKRFPQAAINAGLPMLHIRKQSTLSIPPELSEAEAMKFSNNFVIEKLSSAGPSMWKLEDIEKLRVSLKKKEDGSYDVNYNFEAITNALKDVVTLMREPEGQYFGPAYFIIGPLSHLAVRTEEENIRKHFPTAKFIEVEGANHNIHVEFPKEFIEIVLNNI